MSEIVNIKAGQFRKLDGHTFAFDNVYAPYYMGWVESERKFREFVKFPARITDDVVMSGDERAKPQEGEKMELREKIWNNGKAEFHRYKGKVDKEFFALFKKVFDVELTLEKEVEVDVWNKDEKREVKVKATKVRVKGLGASKVKTALQDLELDTIELVQGKDKAGNPAMVPPFDWEDGVRGNLVGKYAKLKVRGEGMDTRYSFKEALAWIPDAKKEDGGIKLEDIPFK